MGEISLGGSGGKTTTWEGSVFQAKEASRILIKITARGMITKPDKQPLPSSYWAAAVCQSMSSG
jgi:hypothetical protein